MKRSLLALFATFALLISTVGSAGAVTDGSYDGGDHPYVGLAVFSDAAGNPTHRCSGALISTTVFLTAGHCTVDASSARVYFEPEVTSALGYPFEGGVTGTPYTHWNFVWSLPDTSDLGVIVLDEDVFVDRYASVAAIGTLDGLATERGRQETWFTVVGYGLQEVKPTEMAETVRMQATVRLVNLRSALTDGFNVHHTNARGTGGGTCFGDSGGPVLLNGTDIIIGVTSFGLNDYCVGGGFAYRTDIQTAHDFIFSY